MTGIALLLLAAAGGFGASRWLRVPAIPTLVLAGVVVSAVFPLPETFIQDALILGLHVMVFVAGIELSPGRLRFQRRAAIQVGILQFAVLGGIGLGTGLLLGFEAQSAAYLGLAMAASSTLVVIRILQARQQLFEPMGRLVTGVLLLQDLLVILAIPVLTRLSDGPVAISLGLLATLSLVLLAGVVLRWAGPWVLTRFQEEEEILLLLVLSILFGFLALAALFELPMVSGAFLAGVSLSGFPVSGLVRGQLASLSDFFSAIFFTALGAFLPVPSFAQFGQTAAFVLIVIVVTPPLVAILAERSGFSARPALAAGLLLAQTSEFSLVVGLQGILVGQISEEVFGLIVFSTLITMVLTPFLATDRVTWALVHRHPFRAPPRPEKPPEDHVLLIGGGRNGIGLLELLIVTPYRIVVVDDDPALVQWLEESSITAVRGDASDSVVLEAAGVGRARAIVSTIRRSEDNGPLLQLARGIPVIVRAFEDADAEWIRQRGGRAILYSDAAAEDFFEWYRNESASHSTPRSTA